MNKGASGSKRILHRRRFGLSADENVQVNSVNGAAWQGGRVMGRRGAGVEMDRRAAHGPQMQEQAGYSQLYNVE